MKNKTCELCRNIFSDSDVFNNSQLRLAVREEIIRQQPSWNEDSYICESCLDKVRIKLLQDMIEQERGELSALDERVIDSLAQHEIVTQHTEDTFAEGLSFAQKLSDKMASFGGSWKFLILFCVVLTGWIIINQIVPSADKFDPYPFILLNLVLSCLAAVQAPIIMMSQNRQEAKDRLRSEHDYQDNLKAELEIRQLHMKIDQLLKRQWSRLLEIQQMQIEMLQAYHRSMGKDNKSEINSNKKD